MKYIILAAALAASLAAPGFAQTQAPMPAMSAAQMQQMRQMHEQLRSQILGYLTPSSKALLAQIAGELATSPNPNYDAAASRLDGALSATEKKNILDAANVMRAKMRSMMSSMPNAPPGHPMMDTDKQLTPGGIVLMVAVEHGMEMMR